MTTKWYGGEGGRSWRKLSYRELRRRAYMNLRRSRANGWLTYSVRRSILIEFLYARRMLNEGHIPLDWERYFINKPILPEFKL